MTDVVTFCFLFYVHALQPHLVSLPFSDGLFFFLFAAEAT
jgi:hypothetical protein